MQFFVGALTTVIFQATKHWFIYFNSLCIWLVEKLFKQSKTFQFLRRSF